MNHERVSDVLLGGLVSLIGFPLVVGPVAGGWLAGRRSGRPLLAGGVAGLLGGVPWTVLVYLATVGRFPQLGYHTDLIHVGVNPAPPGLFTPLQSALIAALIFGMIVSWACVGGAVHLLTDAEELRPLREAAGQL
jgi:hypothetical protein